MAEIKAGKTGKVDSSKAALAETLKLVVGKNEEQTIPVELRIKHSGITRQNRDAKTGEIFVTHVYDVEGDQLSIEQYKSDSNASNFDPVDTLRRVVTYRSRRMFPADANKLIRAKGGYWHVDERRSITARQLRADGFTQEEIDQQLDMLYGSETKFGDIGEE